jgi:hypothetical protein
MTRKSSPASPFLLDLNPKIAPLRPHNPNIGDRVYDNDIIMPEATTFSA